MATENKISILISAVDEASKVLGKIWGSITDFAKKNEKAFTSMRNVWAVAFGAISAQAFSSISAFKESETQMVRVDQILKNMDYQGLKVSMEQAWQEARNFGDSLQNLSGIGWEQASESFAKLFQITKDVTQAQELATLSADLSIAILANNSWKFRIFIFPPDPSPIQSIAFGTLKTARISSRVNLFPSIYAISWGVSETLWNVAPCVSTASLWALLAHLNLLFQAVCILSTCSGWRSLSVDRTPPGLAQFSNVFQLYIDCALSVSTDNADACKSLIPWVIYGYDCNGLKFNITIISFLSNGTTFPFSIYSYDIISLLLVFHFGVIRSGESIWSDRTEVPIVFFQM